MVNAIVTESILGRAQKKNQVNESKQWLEIQHFMQKKLNSISPSIEIFVVFSGVSIIRS